MNSPAARPVGRHTTEAVDASGPFDAAKCSPIAAGDAALHE